MAYDTQFRYQYRARDITGQSVNELDPRSEAGPGLTLAPSMPGSTDTSYIRGSAWSYRVLQKEREVDELRIELKTFRKFDTLRNSCVVRQFIVLPIWNLKVLTRAATALHALFAFKTIPFGRCSIGAVFYEYGLHSRRAGV
jgi:hypothetical protein